MHSILCSFQRYSELIFQQLANQICWKGLSEEILGKKLSLTLGLLFFLRCLQVVQDDWVIDIYCLRINSWI